MYDIELILYGRRIACNDGKIREIKRFPSLDAFFRAYTEKRIRHTIANSYDVRVKKPYNYRYHELTQLFDDIDYSVLLRYCHVAYDVNGAHYSSDRLIGMRREWGNALWQKSKWFQRFLRRQPGSKRKNYRYHRQIRTFQERKWAHAWDCEEDAPRVRGRRSAHNLPEPWDDYQRCIQRSWKEFRKKQWK